ncbi:MAG: alpha/beta fold hydrolase [Candidatus Lernaella stagnicola]|nr:alpha/beta fold hydrolase [Candidatus Lernaella stagnicola]
MNYGKQRWLLLLIAALLVIVFACGESDENDDQTPLTGDDDDANDDDDDDNNDDNNDDDDTNSDDDTPCDTSKRPIVFVHGFLEVGDAFATQTMRFASNNYCPDRIFAFDYDTLFGPLGTSGRLDNFIDRVLDRTEAEQVDLLGHSLGGAVCYQYLAEPEQASKVAHYVSLASFPNGPVPNGVPGMSVSSAADTMAGSSEIPGGQNVALDDLDHLQVATSEDTFAAIYPFFNEGEVPVTTDILPESDIVLSGRSLVFGTNNPAADFLIRVFGVDSQTGERFSETPVAEYTSDRQGFWGDFAASPDTYYEFEIHDPNDAFPPIHYYFESFPRSNNKLYFRVFPEPDTLLGLVFRLLPYNDDYAIFAYLNLNQAMYFGRDTLAVNGVDLSIPGIMDPEISTIALFFFDANFNGVSDETVAGGLFAFFPFIRFFDMIVPADEPGVIQFETNGRPLTMRNWPSKTGGLAIAVFQ